MQQFEKELNEWAINVTCKRSEMKHLEYKLSLIGSELDDLLHKKPTEMRFLNYKRNEFGDWAFNCLRCGERDISKTKGSKYCNRCSK